MSCEAETIRALRESGSRVTTPRLKIALALRHTGGHRTAEEIHEALAAGDPQAPVALPTVYRTLNTLREHGLVAKIDSPRTRTTYSWVDRDAPHHHLVCARCGAELPLDERVLEALRAAITAETDFEPYLGHLAIPGLCGACRAEA